MRVAFVKLLLTSHLTGVENAFRGQARAAKKEGLPFDFLIVNPERDDVAGDIQYARYPERFASRFLKARHLASVRALRDYDVVFVRYPTAIDLDPLALIRLGPARIATIHHTKEVPEVLSVGRSAGLLGRAAIEWLNGRRILSQVAGIVGVTDEIRDYELARAGTRKPSCTMANGVDVERIPFTGFAPFDGRELHLVIVASDYDHVWHGVDRLIAALEAHRGLPKVVLHVVGRESSVAPGTAVQHPAATVHHHGELQGEALDAVLRKATLAVGTLALFRKGLVQACALKVREYVARGLPFLYAYEDVDLSPTLPFALRLPAKEGAISIPEIVAFAERVSRTPELAGEMRDFASRVLDWRVKMRGLHEFAREIA